MNLKKLDTQFSIYIRMRDMDSYGRVKCCTCENTFHWSEMDAGHFVRRGNQSVRFDERNCHAQCKICNQFEDGCEFEHSLYIEDRYCGLVVHELERLGRIEKHWMQFEIDEMTEEYKLKIKNL